MAEPELELTIFCPSRRLHPEPGAHSADRVGMGPFHCYDSQGLGAQGVLRWVPAQGRVQGEGVPWPQAQVHLGVQPNPGPFDGHARGAWLFTRGAGSVRGHGTALPDALPQGCGLLFPLCLGLGFLVGKRAAYSAHVREKDREGRCLCP